METEKLSRSTPEEETALLKKLTEGDKTAASRLTELKLAKAVQIAEEYHDRGLPGGRSGAGGKYGAVSVRK